MKKIILIPFLWFTVITMGQNDPDILLSYLRLNFAVPDQPAFTVLGSQPSDLLRPSSVNELSAIVSQFYSNNSVSLPQSFAMEIAPGMLIKQNRIRLSEYEKNKVWYSVRFSIGSQRNTNNVYNLAFGLRATLIDKGDLLNDGIFLKKIESVGLNKLADDFDIEEAAAKQVSLKYKNPAGGEYNPADLKLMDSNKEESKYYIACKADITNSLNNYQSEAQIDTDIKQLKEIHKAEYWNKFKWDVAIAWLSTSPDSLVKNLSTRKVAAWTTFGMPCGKWGQFLIGATYFHNWIDTLFESKQIKKNFGTISIPLRLYAGKNRIKGFAEAQYKWDGDANNHNGLLNVGTEFNVVSGIWVLFNAGYTFDNIFTSNCTPQLYTHFDIKFAIPENFNFFK